MSGSQATLNLSSMTSTTSTGMPTQRVSRLVAAEKEMGSKRGVYMTCECPRIGKDSVGGN